MMEPEVKKTLSSVPVSASKALEFLVSFLETEQHKLSSLDLLPHWNNVYAIARSLCDDELQDNSAEQLLQQKNLDELHQKIQDQQSRGDDFVMASTPAKKVTSTVMTTTTTNTTGSASADSGSGDVVRPQTSLADKGGRSLYDRVNQVGVDESDAHLLKSDTEHKHEDHRKSKQTRKDHKEAKKERKRKRENVKM